jgi:hypothetical protein
MKLRLKAAALAAATVLSTSVAANAGTFLATGFSVDGGVNVTMTSPVLQTVQAGQIVLQGTPGGPLDVWCLDLNDVLTIPYLYNVNTFTAGDVRPGIPNLSALQVRQIASLMDFGQGIIGGALANAATQVAIWTAEYGAAFQPVGLDATLQTDVNTLLADTVSGGLFDCPGCTLTVLTDAPPALQDQAVGFVVPGEVPIPATLPLLASGLGLFGWLARRRRKATPTSILGAA